MLEEGFNPDPDPAMEAELRNLAAVHDTGATLKDMRGLLWSSIDNDETRDLDPIEYPPAKEDGSWRLCVGIADVDVAVPKGSAIDAHAAAQTTSVYTGAVIFPMIPTGLSAGATSLFEGADRKSVVVEMIVDSSGTVRTADLYRAVVRNVAQLTYSGVGDWIDAAAKIPTKVTTTPNLEAQLRLQTKIATALRKTRLDNGALEIETVEARAVSADGRVTAIEKQQKNSATDMIEDFMIAANGSVARFLDANHVSAIRRIVRSPERWQRIVELAKQFGANLPTEPDPVALHEFMLARRAADPERFPDLSLAVVKLMGPGEYILDQPGVAEPGHFGLAVQDYTHSTAPNSRYADLVCQRICKDELDTTPPPYTHDRLSPIARTSPRNAET